jgi:tetratricopeptide (TPR) repeat protein
LAEAAQAADIWKFQLVSEQDQGCGGVPTAEESSAVKHSEEEQIRRKNSGSKNLECDLKNSPSEHDPNDVAPRERGLAHEPPGCGLAESHPMIDASADMTASIAPDGVHGSTAIARAFEAAATLHQQGNLPKASEHYGSILGIKPNHFGALFGLATVCVQRGKLDDAVALYRKSLDIDPQRVDAHYNAGAALQALGQLGEAASHYEQALAIQPELPETRTNLGNVLRALNRPEEAIGQYQKALAVRPVDFEARNNLAGALLSLGRAEEAIAQYEQALAIRPDSAEAHFNLGNVFLALNRLQEAVARYGQALAIKPDHTEAHNNLGHALLGLGRAGEAIVRYQRAIAIRPAFAEAYNNIGDALQQLARFKDAIAFHERALAIKPDYAEAHCHLGGALHRVDRPEEACTHCRQAIALNPDYADAHYGLGVALEALGRVDEARGPFERAAQLAPKRAQFHFALALSGRFSPGDPRLAAIEALMRDPALSDNDRITLQFALGKAFGDLEQHEISFRHFLDGNALKRQQTSYDEAAGLRFFERIATIFTAELMQRMRGGGDPSRIPVFVVGMPRSGTTLIEQILASHSKVFGAGELEVFGRTVFNLGIEKRSPVTFPELVPNLSAEELRQLGARYLERMSAVAGAAERIVDKLPLNFTFVGLIHLALPNARIIWARRDPIDTCLSCFSTLFGGDQPHTYDLAELGRYHRAYEALMLHWQRVLPEGVMLEVRYEDVVEDLEGQARRMVEYCDLEWQDACLAFHRTQRPVRTASVAQVRRPIYRSSVGRWRAYEHLLQPLLEALDAVG